MEDEDIVSKFAKLKIGEIIEVPVKKIQPRISEDYTKSYSALEREGSDLSAYLSRKEPSRIVIEDGHHGFYELVRKGRETVRVLKVDAPPHGERPWDP